MPSPASVVHTVPHWFSDALAWTVAFILTLLRSRDVDRYEDLCLYGDAGAYRPDLPSPWARR